MNKKLNVQWFIEQHSDWEKLLSEKPYCLTMSREQWNGMNLLMLKYSQVDSDFNDYNFIRMMVVSIISINFAVPFLKRL